MLFANPAISYHIFLTFVPFCRERLIFIPERIRRYYFTMLETIILYILTSVTVFLALTNIIPYHFSLRNFIIGILLLFCCLTTLYTWQGNSSIFTALFIILSYLCFICRKRIKPLMVICCSLVGYICYILSDSILTQILIKIVHISISDIVNSYQLLYCLMNTIITYLLTFFIGELLKKKYHFSSITMSGPVYITFFSILFISVLMFIFNFVNGEKIGYTTSALTFNGIFVITYSLITLSFTLIMIRYIQRDAKAKSMIEQYHNLEHYTDELERMNLQFRAFRHDYIDILTTLSGYIEDNDMDGLRRTFEEKIAPLGNSMNQSIRHLSSLSHIKIPELKSLISSKVLYAQSHNIPVCLDITMDIESIPMDIIDLVRIMGIFFNNAIEDVLSADKTNASLMFGILKEESRITLVLKNSTLADVSILPAINNLGYSSKGNNRGIGLYNAKEILAHYNNVIHHTDIKDSTFTQTLELYY